VPADPAAARALEPGVATTPELEPGAVDARPGRRFVLAVAALVALGLAIRFPYIWADRRHVPFFGDGYYYHHGANLLADGEGFINPFARVLHGETYEAADHPPLYLVYLSLFSAVGLRSVTAHLLASVLLGLASIVLAGFAGRRVAGDRVGLVAAALVAVAPNVWRYDGAMLSEVAVIPLVLSAVLLGYRYWDRPSLWRLTWLGVVVGLGTLTRPELFLLVPLLVVPLSLLSRSIAWRRRLAWSAVASVAAALLLVPWLVFNATRFDQPVLFTQNLGGTLAGANCETTYYGDIVGSWDYNCPARILEANGITRSEEDMERSDGLVRSEGLSYARSNVGRIPVVVVARLGRVVGIYDPLGQRDLDAATEGVSRWVATTSMVTVPVTIGGAIAGAVVLRRRGRLGLPLYAPIACVLVTVVVFYGASRFRSTAEGPMLVLCAVALDAAWRWARRRRGARAGERVSPAPSPADP
jgi:4-amino-4-deoxy-L-arabinose transferase-like glycosyltransferase